MVRRAARTLACLGVAAWASTTWSSAPLHAQERAATPPARPLLDQLNRETQDLYAEAVHGLVRVQMPAPRWASPVAQRQELIKRWPKLSDAVKRELEKESVEPAPTSQPVAPGEQGGGESQPGHKGGETIVVVPPPPADPIEPEREAVVGGRLEMDAPPAGTFEPNHVGVLLDDAGHVLVPVHVDPAVANAGSIRAAGPDGVIRQAKFVGCDRHTNLTVIKLDLAAEGDGDGGGGGRFNGTPVRLSRERPAEGSVVLYIEPHDGSGRLGLWTGAASDLGIVFTTRGEAAGITRYGQFLNGPACRLIADQVIRYGEVKRARLGVLISELRPDDPLRRRMPVLGTRTAMQIEQVMDGSPAQEAGLLKGDLLLSLAGEAVEDIPSLAAAIAARSGRTELQILRNGEPLKIVVELRRE